MRDSRDCKFVRQCPRAVSPPRSNSAGNSSTQPRPQPTRAGLSAAHKSLRLTWVMEQTLRMARQRTQRRLGNCAETEGMARNQKTPSVSPDHRCRHEV
jgi:hypothetical protein